MNKKIYIIGPASLVCSEHTKLFALTAHELELIDFEPQHCMNDEAAHQHDKATCIRHRINKMLQCNSCLVVPGFEADNIAELELSTAIVSGMPIMYSATTVLPRKISFYVR